MIYSGSPFPGSARVLLKLISSGSCGLRSMLSLAIYTQAWVLSVQVKETLYDFCSHQQPSPFPPAVTTGHGAFLPQLSSGWTPSLLHHRPRCSLPGLTFVSLLLPHEHPCLPWGIVPFSTCVCTEGTRVPIREFHVPCCHTVCSLPQLFCTLGLFSPDCSSEALFFGLAQK